MIRAADARLAAVQRVVTPRRPDGYGRADEGDAGGGDGEGDGDAWGRGGRGEGGHVGGQRCLEVGDGVGETQEEEEGVVVELEAEGRGHRRHDAHRTRGAGA